MYAKSTATREDDQRYSVAKPAWLGATIARSRAVPPTSSSSSGKSTVFSASLRSCSARVRYAASPPPKVSTNATTPPDQKRELLGVRFVQSFRDDVALLFVRIEQVPDINLLWRTGEALVVVQTHSTQGPARATASDFRICEEAPRAEGRTLLGVRIVHVIVGASSSDNFEVIESVMPVICGRNTKVNHAALARLNRKSDDLVRELHLAGGELVEPP